MEFLSYLWHHCHPCDIVISLWFDAFATKCCSYLGTAVTRRYAAYTFEYTSVVS